MSHGQVVATNTLHRPLERRPAVSAWLVTTRALFNQVASFYFQVLDAHPGVVDIPAGDALTTLERLTEIARQKPVLVGPVAARCRE